MFELQQLRHRYPGGQDICFPDWTLAQGEHAVLVGPSGSGKTTLLSIIGGMLKPQHGLAKVAGEEIGGMAGAALDRFRGQRIGLVPQRLHLVASLTVAENLQLAQYLAQLPQDAARVQTVLDRLGLGELARRRPHQLSQGQAQRVAIGRAVVNAPRLLLADEPTANLDDAATHAVISLLEREAEAVGATLLIASHDGRVKSHFQRHLVLGAHTAEVTA
ncbi:MAG: ATP-binding cassette domain-containing protein [Burkholderiales bacterium]|nr:ATP-binding cassette domain-containing protein [Burkholderiales bacterium]